MKTLLKLYVILSVFSILSLAQPTYAATPLSKPKGLKITATTEHRITIQWKKVDKAKGYFIHWRNLDSDKTKTLDFPAAPEQPEFIIKKLKCNTPYQISVQAYRNKTLSPKSKKVETTTLLFQPDKPDVSLTMVPEEKIHISWKPVPYATQYEIRIRNANNELIKQKFTTKLHYNFKNFESDVSYKIVVRAIREKQHQHAYSPFWTKRIMPKSNTYYKNLAKTITIENPYEETGRPTQTYTKEQLEAFANYGNDGAPLVSTGPYLLWCNRITYHMMIFKRNKYNQWELLYYWPCIIGRAMNPTRSGVYQLNRLFIYKQYGSNHATYGTSYSGDNAIHSLLYPQQTDSLSEGYQASYGCIRVEEWQAKFIYEKCNDCTLWIR